MRANHPQPHARTRHAFPFLFGGTFIEGLALWFREGRGLVFPFLFGGTFIEGLTCCVKRLARGDFPSFSEGLSLRDQIWNERQE